MTSNLLATLLFTIIVGTSLTSYAQCNIDPNNVYSFQYDGHTYEVVKEVKNWLQAANCAIDRDGYLAEIDSEAEHNALFSAITSDANIDITNTENSFGTAAVWLGGSDALTEGNWIWDGNNDGTGTAFWSGSNSGSPVDGAFNNWGFSPPEPDNSGNQDKLTLTIAGWHPNFGLWNDLDANDNLYFVIEHNTLLAVEEYSIGLNYKIYPNPATDILFIEAITDLSISKIEITDQTGKTVLEANKDQRAIDVSALAPGVYFLNIISNELPFIQKVILE